MDKPSPNRTAARLEIRAALLLILLILLVVGAIGYLLYARGAFEPTQRLVLVADDAEGVIVGMDLSFSGFPIGRVQRIELARDGTARILVDIPLKDAHWLRESSVFTLVRNLVGGTNLRAFTGIPDDPPLPDGAQRKVLVGDATAEIPRLVAQARDLVQNLTALTGSDSALNQSLNNVRDVTQTLKDRGAMNALFGDGPEGKKLGAALDRANALLARIDGLTAKADAQVFGPEGVMPEVRATVAQLNAVLGDARTTLKKVDGVLQEAQAVATNAREVTTDLGPLRAEVEASLRKVESLVDEINRKWPFARDTELKLR